MARVSRGVQAHAIHKKILKKAKGYYGARSQTAFSRSTLFGQNMTQVRVFTFITATGSFFEALCSPSIGF
jgi:ribosomal protein L20